MMRAVFGDPTPSRIVFARPGGQVVVVSPAESVRAGESDADYCARIAARARLCAAEAGEPWATDAQHVATVHRDELTTCKRWRGQQRIINGKLVKTAEWPLRWDHAAKKLFIDLPLARAQILAEVDAEIDDRLSASQAAISRVKTTDIQRRKAHTDYQDAIRDMPSRVQADIASLPLAELERYSPPWPIKPN